MGKQYSNRLNSHLQKTIQTHNAVSVAGSNGTSASSWIDTDGFDKLAVTLLNDASTSSSITIFWSNNGSTSHGIDDNLVNNTVNVKSTILDTKSRYAMIRLNNADAAAHTMSAWVLLKA